MKLRLLDDTLKYLPILGVILIISGNIKLLVYYKMFNFEIFPFVSLDEILILFMQNSLAYLVLLTGCTISLLMLKLDRNDLHFSFKKRLVKYLTNKRPFVLLILLTILGLVHRWTRSNPNDFELFLIMIAFIFVTYVSPIVIQELFILLDLKKGKLSTVFLVMIFTSMIIFSIASAVNEGHKVKHGFYQRVRMVFDDCVFQSNRNQFYIGQTKNYVFVYDSNRNSVTSYSIEKIRSIKF